MHPGLARHGIADSSVAVGQMGLDGSFRDLQQSVLRPPAGTMADLNEDGFLGRSAGLPRDSRHFLGRAEG